MIPIPKHAKNVKISIVNNKETKSIKAIHYEYEVDIKNIEPDIIEIDNTPSIMRTIINQGKMAYKLFTEIIEKQKINKSLNK